MHVIDQVKLYFAYNKKIVGLPYRPTEILSHFGDKTLQTQHSSNIIIYLICFCWFILILFLNEI